MEIFFLFIVSILTIPTLISLLYSFYKYRRLPKGQTLLTIKPRSPGRKIYGIFLSIIFVLIAASSIVIGIGEELRGHRIDIVGWVVIVEISLFFGILSLIIFQRKGEKVIEFTEKGLIVNYEFFGWDEIDEFEWESPIKFLGIIVNFKKDMSGGKILFFRSGWRWRRSYHSFDDSTKQHADEIMRNKGKIRFSEG